MALTPDRFRGLLSRMREEHERLQGRVEAMKARMAKALVIQAEMEQRVESIGRAVKALEAIEPDPSQYWKIERIQRELVSQAVAEEVAKTEPIDPEVVRLPEHFN